MAHGFGLDNLPYGAIRPRGGRRPELAVRLGDDAVSLVALEERGLLVPAGLPAHTLDGPVLNPLLALGRDAWEGLRATLQRVLADGPPLDCSVRLTEVDVMLPVAVGDYVDFYSSLEHATNLGRMFRPDADPLLPNWRHLPVGYHGRASSVVPSGTPVRRPRGQLPPAEPGGAPAFGPSQRLDIELELGFVTGPGNTLGTSIPAGEAADHVFGFVLVNDWSARDIQRWEYQPLGPFLGKSFATSISPWVVPLAALEPFRVAPPAQDPKPLEYLRAPGDWALDIPLEVELEDTVISRGNARGLYWTFPQQLAHATSNGTNVRPGDLYASGTISGAEPGTEGSLIELTRGGREPLALADGRSRTFLEDGDTVVVRGWCGDRDAPAVSFGDVAGTILPAEG
ncbi:MAG TPA: fumarylacetoacetase [Solirubrobacteraceae bacterium]|nr:fumarylacetoacetase [Solirubrobacteraceae bacterium]